MAAAQARSNWRGARIGAAGGLTKVSLGHSWGMGTRRQSMSRTGLLVVATGNGSCSLSGSHQARGALEYRRGWIWECQRPQHCNETMEPPKRINKAAPSFFHPCHNAAGSCS